jgi:type VI secretion system protein ImpM
VIAGGAPGFYGKVPIRGDFVSRRLPWTFIDPWDRWLQEGLACSREQLRDAWLQIYLTSPVWRFALTPGVCGDSGWVGVVLPSVDRVGRYFPLTVARPWTGADSALVALTGWADWLQRAERLGLSALEEGFDLDAFDRAVEDAGAPPAINGRAPPAQGGPVGTPPPFGWHFAAAESGDRAPGFRSLGETLLQALLPLHSAWSSQGSDLVAPCQAIARGLPPASGFAALLNGEWARWGWAQAAAVRTPVAIPAAEPAHAIDPPPVAPPRAARWSSAACTHTGKVRTHNEDACLALPERGIWAVADGMGGHAQGDVASREVVESLRALPDEPELAELTAAAAAALGRVNASLRQRATSLAAQGGVIGSTVVLLLARGGHASCVWAGDSRIYLYRDGELRALTRDHSLVEELVLRGEISPEHALAHPEANALTRAVGGEDRLEVDEVCVDARPGDLFLLCSDGLTKEMPHGEIAAALAGVTDLQGACEALVQGALARGGRDNVTVVLARFEA